jgi:hypothetical protein
VHDSILEYASTAKSSREVISSNIIKTPKFSRDRAKKKKEEKEKLQESLQINGKLIF